MGVKKCGLNYSFDCMPIVTLVIGNLAVRDATHCSCLLSGLYTLLPRLSQRIPTQEYYV